MTFKLEAITGTYFEPHNVAQLVTILEKYPKRNYSEQLYESYESRMHAAAYELLAIFKN